MAKTSLFPKGLNGNAGKHVVHTDEVNQKISNSKKGVKRKPFSDEHRKKISASCKGRSQSDEHKRKISNALKGRQLSEEHKIKISLSKSKIAYFNHNRD